MKLLGVRFHRMKVDTIKAAIEARAKHVGMCPDGDKGRMWTIYTGRLVLVWDRDGHKKCKGG